MEEEKMFSQQKGQTKEFWKIQAEIAQAERDKLKEELEKKEEEIKDAAIVQFWQEINSKEKVYVLDNMYQQMVYLREMRRTNKENIPPHVMGIISSSINLFKALEKMGIVPFGNVGEEFEIKESMLDDFELVGSPIESGMDKKVRVSSPGWKYKDQIISVPKIQRINDKFIR